MKTIFHPHHRRWLLLCLFLAGPAVAQTRLVEPREVPLSLVFEAQIEATKQATVATQVAGRIIDVRVDAGQKVSAGQLLMQVDAREAAENVAGARAQLVQAEANYQRTLNLFQKKFVSQAALDAAEAQLKSARAQANAAGASASHAAVTAPIAGVVAQRHAELGDLAVLGKPLVTVFDPKSLRAVTAVPQAKLAEVRRAQSAQVEIVEPSGRRRIAGTRVEILPTIDTQSRTATVRVYLPEGEGLLPGMAARVFFIAGEAKKLTVPAAAILRRGEISTVYVLKDGKAVLRQVRLGEATADGEVEVLAGLSAGETIALDPVKTGIEAKQAK
jgi:RND family efflux transporter MFP subunit